METRTLNARVLCAQFQLTNLDACVRPARESYRTHGLGDGGGDGVGVQFSLRIGFCFHCFSLR